MTLLAGRGHARLDVIRIRRPLEIGHVASDAIRARQVVIVVHMALNTLQTGVRAGQRKARAVVVECSVGPRNSVVALVAGL